MRYMILFKDQERRPIRVSQEVGEIVMRAKMENANVEVRGALIDTVMISDIRPINKFFYGRDMEEMSARSELANPEERKWLELNNALESTIKLLQ